MLNALSFDTNMLIGLAIDALVVLILVLFAVIGGKKGLIKMFFGLISFALVIVSAVYLVKPITSLVISRTNLDDKLMTSLETPIASKLPGSYTTLYYADFDNDPETPDELVCDKNGTPTPYEYVFEGTIFENFGVHKLMKPLVEKALANTDRIYLVDAITFSIASIILFVGVFVALLIIMPILVTILMHLLKKAVASFYVAHFLDRLLGFILGLVLGAAFALVLITLVQLLQDMSFMEPVMAAVKRSYLTKFIMDNNVLYTLINKAFDIRTLLANLFPASNS